jgi:hypothetical protein
MIRHRILNKPYRQDDLARAVREILDMHGFEERDSRTPSGGPTEQPSTASGFAPTGHPLGASPEPTAVDLPRPPREQETHQSAHPHELHAAIARIDTILDHRFAHALPDQHEALGRNAVVAH